VTNTAQTSPPPPKLSAQAPFSITFEWSRTKGIQRAEVRMKEVRKWPVWMHALEGEPARTGMRTVRARGAQSGTYGFASPI